MNDGDGHGIIHGFAEWHPGYRYWHTALQTVHSVSITDQAAGAYTLLSRPTHLFNDWAAYASDLEFYQDMAYEGHLQRSARSALKIPRNQWNEKVT